MESKDNKLLILVGPGSSFGLHTALRFARQGFQICLVGRSMESLLSIKSRLKSLSKMTCTICKCDVVTDSLADLIIDILNRYSYTEICIIYNLKSSPKGSILEANPQGTEKIVRTSLLTPIQLIQKLLRLQSISNLKARIQLVLTGGGYKDSPDRNKFYLSLAKSLLYNVYLNTGHLNNDLFCVKTLTIDGVVGQNIEPERVSEGFYSLWQQEASSGELIVRPWR